MRKNAAGAVIEAEVGEACTTGTLLAFRDGRLRPARGVDQPVGSALEELPPGATAIRLVDGWAVKEGEAHAVAAGRAARAAVGLGVAVLVLALAGCSVPVSMEHPIGSAYVEIWDSKGKDGSETCHAKASGGLDAKGVGISADLCRGGDKLAGTADALTGSAAQQAALASWERMNEAQKAEALKVGSDVLRLAGPGACAAVLTALGVPGGAAVCAGFGKGAEAPAPASALLVAPDRPRHRPRGVPS